MKIESKFAPLTDGVVTLSPITVADVTPGYVDWLNDPFVNRWLETRWTIQTLETVRDYVRVAIADPDTHLFAIRVGGKHIGNIKLGPVNRAHGFCDCSYFIGDRDSWGKGHATRAVLLATHHAFKALGMHRVQAGAYAQNIASQRVLKKAGFAEEGRLHRALKTETGWSDHVLFGRCCEQVAL